MARVILELLSKRHNRESFDCGRLNQNDFLKQRARKHAEINFSKTWVAVEEGDTRILGFATVSMGNVVFEEMSDDLSSKLPRYPMPVLHVGQLATDSSFMGRGIGALMLKFAAEKSIEASKKVGCFAIELVADNDEAFQWYLRRGFIPIVANSRRLYQSIENLKNASSQT